ncbi:hypothetical protein HMPREF0005_04476 [Achromobacter xylosoxidans C54]|nr:hypothetical protein HMPREF0005_04476 [Achromobacter xylosoxidans C54]
MAAAGAPLTVALAIHPPSDIAGACGAARRGCASVAPRPPREKRMAIALTYFADHLSDEALAALLRRREDFYIENIDAMNSLTARMRALLAEDGLHSVVRLAPLNESPGRLITHVFVEAAFLLVWLWLLLQSLAHCLSRRPRADVILRVTSNASLHVAFRPSAHRAAATP